MQRNFIKPIRNAQSLRESINFLKRAEKKFSKISVTHATDGAVKTSMEKKSDDGSGKADGRSSLEKRFIKEDKEHRGSPVSNSKHKHSHSLKSPSFMFSGAFNPAARSTIPQSLTKK